MVKETRAKLICDRCRKGHLKCDNQQSDCGRCQAAGKRCHRSNDIKFRKRLNTANFSDAQRARTGPSRSERNHTWVNTNDAPIRFVDVTQDVVIETSKPAHGETTVGEAARVPSPTSVRDTTNSLQSPTSALSIPAGSSPFSPATSFQAAPAEAQANSAWAFELGVFDHGTAFNPSADIGGAFFGTDLSPTLQFQNITDAASQGLNTVAPRPQSHCLNLKEAELVRHYADHLAPWLDTSNRDRYFETTIPSQALQRPCLLNAILGIAARHRSRTSDYDPLAYETYVRRCLSLYTPPLTEEEGDELLALTGILRLFEGLEVSLATFDPASPLAAWEDMAWSRSAHYSTSEVSQLLIRSGLRQDIHTSFFRQEAVTSLLDAVVLDRTLSPANDYMWADRMLVHLGDILRFCFGAADSSPLKWTQLMEYSQQWWENRPESFAPLYYKDPDPGELFPDVWLTSDCHVAAIQHYHLGMIMLKVYNPRVPRLGPSRKEWLIALEKEMKYHVCQVCGIALSNPRVVPALLTACHAIATCGESFKEKWEQDQLLQILTKARRGNGWLTSTLQTQLKDAWGYESPM